MKREGNTSKTRPVLLVGAGRKPKELGTCIAALGAVRAQLEDGAIEPHRPQGLGDLEELLSQRPTEGTLILDYERVPAEDIGFVRRFLERHPDWRLIVVGEDPRDRRARGLLGLTGAQWLAWPPDLDQVGALIGSPGSTAAGESSGGRRRRRQAPTPRPDVVETIDVGNLLEELLAGASLAGEGAPRYLYRCDHTLLLKRERPPLADGLSALLSLARRCAGSEGVVSAQADRATNPGDPTDTVRIRIDFPPGELREEDVPRLLDGPFGGAPALAEDVERAHHGTQLLRESGLRVEVLSPRADRLRLELHVASTPLAPKAAAPKRAAAAQARQGKAEDPFA